MLRQQRNRFRTTQRNNRRSPVRGKDRGTRSIRRYTKGEIPRGEAWPRSCETCYRAQAASVGPHESFHPPSKVANLHFPRTSGPSRGITTSWKRHVRRSQSSVQRRTSHFENLLHVLLVSPLCDRSLPANTLARRCSREIPWNFPRKLL